MLPLTFKIAAIPAEMEQIHRLNYRTFVEEIPQHEPNALHALRDRFHDENTYIVAQRAGDLLGMVAVRDKRPFSLDTKVPELDSYLPAGRTPCEIRLLTVLPEHRHSRVVYGLMSLLAEYCAGRGYDLALICGLVERRRLYDRLGFVPFAAPVGTPGALFQPMYITLERFEATGRGLFKVGHN